jgi:hypothetical protein
MFIFIDNKESITSFQFDHLFSLIQQLHILLYLSFLVTHFLVHMDNNYVLPYFHNQHKYFEIFHYTLQSTILAKEDSLFQQFLLIMS